MAEAFLAAAVDSPATRRAYRRHLADAQAALRVTSPADLSGAQLATYRAELLADGRGPATHAQALAALRAFLRWSGTFGAHLVAPDVVREALRVPRSTVSRPYQVLAEGEIAALLATVESSRDRALLAVLLGAGLRAAEAAGLDVPDLREDDQGAALLYVRQGKGRRDRQVPIRAEVFAELRRYLAATGRTLASSGALFRAHDRGAARRARHRLTSRTVGNVVAGAIARAGVAGKAISPHSLRHTFALRALRGGANVVAVAKLLGHASVTTTQRYVDHLGLAELRAAVPPLPLAP